MQGLALSPNLPDSICVVFPTLYGKRGPSPALFIRSAYLMHCMRSLLLISHLRLWKGFSSPQRASLILFGPLHILLPLLLASDSVLASMSTAWECPADSGHSCLLRHCYLWPLAESRLMTATDKCRLSKWMVNGDSEGARGMDLTISSLFSIPDEGISSSFHDWSLTVTEYCNLSLLKHLVTFLPAVSLSDPLHWVPYWQLHTFLYPPCLHLPDYPNYLENLDLTSDC